MITMELKENDRCGTCLHGKICIHRKTYEETCRMMQEIFDQLPEKDKENMIFQKPDCRHFIPKVSFLEKRMLKNKEQL